MLLLTTPDYLPKLGGLSSHTLNVEKVLKEIGVEYELFHWKNYKDIITFPKESLSKFDYILNIHSGFHMYMPESKAKVINFVNGAEILFYSPNLLKHLVKQVLRSRNIKRMEQAEFNIFISDFTFKTLIKKGLTPDYARDLIFHMTIDTSSHHFVEKKWNQDPLRFVCVARDVPHKNFKGAIKFCEDVREISGREVEFVTITNKKFTSDKIKITSAINPDNNTRDELLTNSHINLLLSLDHSHRGFFEGFGQVVQEAGCLGTPSLVLKTGGLPESVHHNETGWVLPDLKTETVKSWWAGMNEDHYGKISRNCYQHTLDSHGLNNWVKLFRSLLKKT